MTADEILEKIMRDGVVSCSEVDALERLVKADWIVDRNEVELLFKVNKAIGDGDEHCPEWTDFFVSTVTRLIVEDLDSPGVIDQEEGDWLGNVFRENKCENASEKKLIFRIQNTTTEIQGSVSEFLAPFE